MLQLLRVWEIHKYSDNQLRENKSSLYFKTHGCSSEMDSQNNK